MENLEILDTLNRLVDSPPEIVNLIVSYIPNPFLPLFLEYKPLVPYILPAIHNKVRIQQDYYNAKHPLRFLGRHDCRAPPVFSLMEELDDFVTKFGVYPREIELKRALDLTPTEKKLDALIPLKDEVPDFKESNLVTWSVRYCGIFRRAELIHLLDLFHDANFHGLLSCIALGFRLGSVTFYSRNAEAVLDVCPNTMEKLLLRRYGMPLSSIALLKFRSLKILELDQGDLRLFKSLPQTLSTLKIEILVTNVNFNRDEKIPIFPNLNSFQASLREAGKFSSVVGKFPNLKSLSLHNTGITSFDELGVPETITDLKLSDVLVDGASIKKLRQLMSLELYQRSLPERLFDDEDNFPELRVFKFLQPGGMPYYQAWICNLNQLRLPLSLRVIKLDAYFLCTFWMPPPGLQGLTLQQTYFVDFFTPLLPITLTRLAIVSTTIESMDCVEFPDALLELRILENPELKSMVYTNLSTLTQLVKILVISNPKLAKVDKPNKELGCIEVYALNQV
ncbi:hypothetical protein Cantr_06379 [Candida viswanathii]|uniref:F-box domain-containing protein n=1 Tax=Candida viswanathii TaxID=5486 RepID=A0A367XVR9_9ASCO|nr:hypothetical protein Cantr_06379 [Candida viswanathii]